MPDNGAIERLEKKLGNNGGEPPRSRLPLKSAPDSQPSWKSLDTNPGKPRRPLKPVEIAFMASAAFFVIAAGIAALIIFSGTNTVSTRNVSIAVSGPTSLRAGDTLPLQIVVTNKNSVPMQLTDLVVEYPAGTRSEADVSIELPRIRESLGDIKPGESVNKTERAVIFGSAGDILTTKISVEYRVPSSNAIFHSEATYAVPISESPASVTIDGLSEVTSGQPVTLTATVASNVTDVLPKMLLIAEYPPGFSFTSANPTPTSAGAVWNLGDIEPGGKRTITIKGIFQGDDGEKKVIHFTTGTAADTTLTKIAAPLASADNEVTVAKPFVAATLAMDGDTAASHVITRGKPVRVDVNWQNNLPTRIQDLDIEVKLNGSILDRNSVTAQKGFFRSSDNTVVFAKENDPTFADVAPGASGVASFTFMTLSTGSGTFKNPQINLSVTVTARRVSESNVPETVTASASGAALVQSDLTLAAALAHTGADTGPVPPKADHETTYTVTWTVTNSQNAIGNASVSAVLPSYVRFLVSPSGITYNAVGGIVTWNVGDLAEGATRTATFQIGVTPSVTQVNSNPTVISDQRVSGRDRFSLTPIEATTQPLTTSSGTTFQQGNVVP